MTKRLSRFLISFISIVMLVTSVTGCAKKDEEVVKPEESKVGVFNEAKTYEESQTYESGVISTDGVVLKNAIITNDLIISDEVGDGTIYLDNVKVKGKLIVEGGGENSIHVDNSEVGKIVSNRQNGRVRIDVSENTTVDETEILQDTKLEVSGSISNIKVGETAKGSEVLVNTTATVATLETKGEISLTVDASIGKLSLHAPSNVTLNASVENIAISKEAENTAITVAKDVIITNLATEGKVDVQGEGKITNATSTDKNNITGNVKPDSTVISETPISDQANSTIAPPTATATTTPKPTVAPTPTTMPWPTVEPTPDPKPEPTPTPVPLPVTAVVISGTAKVGETLTAVSDGNVVKAITWYANDVEVGTNSSTYVVGVRDYDKTIKVKVNTVISTETSKVVLDNGTAIVNTSEQLTDALTMDYKNIIISGTLGSTSAYTIYRVEKPVEIIGLDGNKIHGSFIVDADNVTIDGLEIHNQGWKTGDLMDARRNAITVVSNKVSIRNNKLIANNSISTDQAISNGIVISAGSNVNTSINVENNKITGYGYDNASWSSTGIIINQGSDFPYNTKNTSGQNKTVALTVDASSMAKVNTYENCYNDYIKSNYATGSGFNVYEYAYVSNASGIIGGLFFAHPMGSIIELAPARYDINKQITHEGTENNYFTTKNKSTLIVPSNASLNINEDTELVVEIGGTVQGTVNGRVNDKNVAPVDPIISNASVTYTAASENIVVKFDLDKGFNLNMYEGLTTLDEITAAYTSYLMGDVNASANANKIKNDLILVYYYKNASGEKVPLLTNNKAPLAKFKLWNGYLNYFDGSKTVPLADGISLGGVPTYITQMIPNNKTWTSSTNPKTGTVSQGWLNDAKGSAVYVDIIVLYEGKTIIETVSVAIPGNQNKELIEIIETQPSDLPPDEEEVGNSELPTEEESAVEEDEIKEKEEADLADEELQNEESQTAIQPQ